MKINVLLLSVLSGAMTLSASAQSSYTKRVGDYDQDGKIGMVDIATMVNVKNNQAKAPLLTGGGGQLTVNGTACNQYLYGDMDLDGDIDALDIEEMAKVVLGIKEAPWLVRTYNAKQTNYANVQDYGPLKGYINRVDHPNFKAAAAIDVNDFCQKGSLYNLVCENFDEVVAGNAMKMASVVGSNGYMNFTTVKRFVNTATDAGLNVYGHVLAWHSQQPNAWLASLIADRKRPVTGTEVTIFERDFEDESQVLGGWGNSSTRVVSEGALKLSNPSVGDYTYSAQAMIDVAEPLVKGQTYTLKMKVKSSVSGQLLAGLQKPDGYVDCGNFAPINLTKEWTECSVDCECTGTDATRFLFSFGQIAGDIWIDDLQLYTIEADNQQTTTEVQEMLVDYDFSTSDQLLNGWGNSSTRAIEDGVMVLDNPSVTEHDYNVQAAIDFTTPLRNGYTYTLKMKIKAETEGSIGLGFQKMDGYGNRGNFPSVTLTKSWQNVEIQCTVDGEGADRFLISYGNIIGKIYIDDMQLFTYVSNSDGTGSDDAEMSIDPDIDYLVCRDFADEEQNIGGWGNESSQKVSDGVQVFSNPSAVNYWEVQAAIDFDEALEVDRTYTVSMRVRSDAEGQLRVGFQNPNGYANCGSFEAVTLSSSWQSVKMTCTVTGENAKRFIFSYGDVKGNIYIDNLQLYIDPYVRTMAEKKEILTEALGLWIDNMMAATDCKVKDWDMINEAISGGGDVNGYYDLQHFSGFQAGTWDVGGANFFWQDYLGSEDYGVIVERLARKAFADHGGNPDDLKLFVNDYNLESDWDDNKKLKSLIYWVGIWEKGGAKIDGLGTQMHINYCRNASTQASKEEHITKMFELMAATGKMVRVSELDMGVTDASGNSLTVNDITDDDRVAMAKYYEFIVKQYLTIIPKEQQYGICQWSLTDSPESNAWRENEPIGIYTLQYGRKPAYAGWAEGLKESWER